MKILKNILFPALLMISTSFKSFSQQMKNYDAAWRQVNELIEKKNLPASALAEVKKIYTQAKKDGQDAQVIKALVYMTGLQQENREDNIPKAIKEVEQEIKISKEPAVSIMQSMEAGLYLQYLQQHRYQLYDRSNTIGFNKDDIATWTIDDLHRKISELYLQSISKEQLLQSTKLEPFDAIIIKGNIRYLRPTLFDLLVNEALEYFKTDERDIKKAAYAFEINQQAAFAPAATFAAHNFSSKDSFSLQQKALMLYQKLVTFHLHDQKKDALIDADIARLDYVHDHAVMEDKDSLYREALNNIIQSYNSNPVTAQASFLLAQSYNISASTYEPFKDTTHRFDRIKAREILEKVVKDSSLKNEGWINSYNMLQQIQQPSFSFQVEKVNVPDQPFRVLVHYQNTNNLYLRLIPVNSNLKTQIPQRYLDEKGWDALLGTAPLKTWQQSLPATNDLQQHSVEIKIDALPVGEYFLLASIDNQIKKAESILAADLFYVSNISYINKGKQFFVLHRETGQPLANASVQLYQQQYDYKTSKYINQKQESYTTDRNGFFQVAEQKNNEWDYMLEIKHGQDHLFINSAINYIYYNPYDKSQEETVKQDIHAFFFTDRSIYRPGQTVYFKAIFVDKANKNNSLATAYKAKVYLQNVNQEVIDSMELTSNDYGSVNGKFVLPQNTLNGEFSIRVAGIDEYASTANFSVEEYKRPKFYVDFEKIQKSYKVNDTITAVGNAKAYAGNIVDGAKVVYRVVRQPRFIWYTMKWWMPPGTPLEITHGETTTDKEGKFTLQFAAIPDRTINPSFDPVFDYVVYADVTDINGETRSGNQTITAGYTSLLLDLRTEERMPLDSFEKLYIRTENLNGVYQPSQVTVSIFKLVPENRLIRERLWDRPDQYVMNKAEFIRNFPHDEYENESDYKTWGTGEKVISITDTTHIDGTFNLKNTHLAQGYYMVECTTTDKDGHAVKHSAYIELYDAKSNQFSKPEYLWSKASDAVEPGQKATLAIGSSADNVFVIHQTVRTGVDDSKFDYTQLNKEKKSYDYPVSEADRGGFGASFLFVKDNRFYQFNDAILVPRTNKELEIEFTTFRDKTLPGSDEQWKVKIKGSKNEQVAAEMLASMYDASLDQFRMHQWEKPGIWSNFQTGAYWSNQDNFDQSESFSNYVSRIRLLPSDKRYDQLAFTLYENLYQSNGIPGKLMGKANGIKIRGYASKSQNEAAFDVAQPAPSYVEMAKFTPPVVSQSAVDTTSSITTTIPQQQSNNPAIQIRKNFNETAFFFPDLHTDKDGNIEFSFKAPEALTTWKLQTFAHTKELAMGLGKKELITQKQLMVQPNTPRFLRQGDHMEFAVKIVNLSDSEMTGQAQLELIDATTNQSVDGWFMNTFPNQYFTVAAGQSEVVKFPIQVPFEFNKTLVWRVTARSGNTSDGEEDMLPVLSNKILVTETLPIPMKGSGSKSFSFDKLLQSGNSETLQQQAITVEYTSNPAWYAVQALPYLMEYPYECAEQIWNRYYANALASKIATTSPRMKQIFEKWKQADTAALMSNLQKNQELKAVLLEETPWVLQANSEAQQKKNIALLFDLMRMNNELEGNLQKLQQMQSGNGGFVWFKGGPDNRYITQYIVTGIGHLKKLGAATTALQPVLNTAIPYLDQKIKEDYDHLVEHKADLNKEQIGYMQIQYLYMRSFFTDIPVPSASVKAYNYYKQQAKQFWMHQNKYMQGMTALALNRTGDAQTPAAILKSLKETAIRNEELGMYWKNQSFGYSWMWWYAPIETQALMIEAFTEAGHDTKTADDLKTWLLKNKQTNNWQTTKATADACYALLLQGSNWLEAEPVIAIKLGSVAIYNTTQKTEAGTGYFKQTVPGAAVRPEMGNINVTVQQPQNGNANTTSWGAVYWQYFEDMDKVSTATTPLQLKKKLFIEKLSDRGPVLSPISEGSELHVGDKIIVRIELRADRDMEYVHMKDMRASGLEPVNVISGYKWQNGLGYYETTKDASTNFFFDLLRKGTYVFEYPVFVTHTGDFSNGITTIQCMYAPEFSAHSEGIRITVE